MMGGIAIIGVVPWEVDERLMRRPPSHCRKPTTMAVDI
jgi:hypothetical protein